MISPAEVAAMKAIQIEVLVAKLVVLRRIQPEMRGSPSSKES